MEDVFLPASAEAPPGTEVTKGNVGPATQRLDFLREPQGPSGQDRIAFKGAQTLHAPTIIQLVDDRQRRRLPVNRLAPHAREFKPVGAIHTRQFVRRQAQLLEELQIVLAEDAVAILISATQIVQLTGIEAQR